MVAGPTRKEVNPIISERNWEQLLAPDTASWLEEARREVFKEQYEQGFHVVTSIPQDSGRLVTVGTTELIKYVRRYVALEEIDRLRAINIRDGENKLYVYGWEEKAIVPKSGWQQEEKLTKDDFTLDLAGITIFARKI